MSELAALSGGYALVSSASESVLTNIQDFNSSPPSDSLGEEKGNASGVSVDRSCLLAALGGDSMLVYTLPATQAA